MIKSIAFNFNWTPKEIDELYCDDFDHHGIVYWFKEIKKQSDKTKK